MTLRRVVVRVDDPSSTLSGVSSWLNTVSASLLAYVVINTLAGSQPAGKEVRLLTFMIERPALGRVVVLLGVSIICGLTYSMRLGLGDPARWAGGEKVLRYLWGSSEGRLLVAQTLMFIAAVVSINLSKENVMAPKIPPYVVPWVTPDSDRLRVEVGKVIEAVARVESRIGDVVTTVGQFREDILQREGYREELRRLEEDLKSLTAAVVEVKNETRETGTVTWKRIEVAAERIEQRLKQIERIASEIGPFENYRGELREIRDRIGAVGEAVKGLIPHIEGLKLERSGVR